MNAPHTIKPLAFEVTRDEMIAIVTPFVGARMQPREWGKDYPTLDINEPGYCLVDANVTGVNREGILTAGHYRGERQFHTWDAIDSITIREGDYARCLMLVDEPMARASESYSVRGMV